MRARPANGRENLEGVLGNRVDTAVVEGLRGGQFFPVSGDESVWRLIAETMNEAALTVGLDGTILFCNHRFCELMKTPFGRAIGQPVTAFAVGPQRALLKRLLAHSRTRPRRRRFVLSAADGTAVPVQLSASPPAATGDTVSICLVASDLTELEASARSMGVLREHHQAMEQSQAELLASRRAALRRMKDALRARRRAEELNAALRKEIEVRKRTGEALRQSQQRFRRLERANILGILTASPKSLLDANDEFLRIVGYSREDLCKRRLDWPAMTPREYAPRDQSGLRQLRARGWCRPFEKEYIRKDGRRVPILIGAALLRREPFQWISFVLDLTARKRLEADLKLANACLEQRVAERTADLAATNQRLRGEVAAHSRARQSLLRVNRALQVHSLCNEALVRAGDETRYLQRVCDIIVHCAGYRQAWIGFVENPEDKHLRLIAEAGFEKGYLQSLKLTCSNAPSDALPLSIAMRGTRLLIDQSPKNPRRGRPWLKAALQKSFRSGAAFPLRLEGRLIGVLVIYGAEATEMRFLAELADAVVNGIGDLRAKEERLRLQHEVLAVSEAEQRRLGQEMHDGLCAQLTGLRFANETLQKKLRRSAPSAAGRIERMGRLLADTAEQARNLALMLNPVEVEAEGLMVALDKLAADTQRLYGRSVRFVCPHPVLVGDPATANHFYRLAQEAVRNALTHGKASRVTIGLLRRDGQIELSIANNGRRFPKVLPLEHGMGLRNMRYRAEAIGARLETHAGLRRGMLVTCSLPVTGQAPGRKCS